MNNKTQIHIHTQEGTRYKGAQKAYHVLTTKHKGALVDLMYIYMHTTTHHHHYFLHVVGRGPVLGLAHGHVLDRQA